MSFSFLKKKSPLGNLFGLGKSSGKKSSKGHKLKQSVAGQGYDKASKALEPKDKGNGKAPDARSFFGKVDDALGIGQATQSTAWCKRRWKDVRAATDKVTVESARGEYRDVFLTFLEGEYCDENLLAVEALDFGVSNQEFFDNFASDSAEHQLNFSGKELKLLRKQAADGDYDSMNFEKIREACEVNLTDPISRFRLSDILKKHIFEKLTSQVAPDKVGGGYK